MMCNQILHSQHHRKSGHVQICGRNVWVKVALPVTPSYQRFQNAIDLPKKLVSVNVIATDMMAPGDASCEANLSESCQISTALKHQSSDYQFEMHHMGDVEAWVAPDLCREQQIDDLQKGLQHAYAYVRIPALTTRANCPRSRTHCMCVLNHIGLMHTWTPSN